MWATIFGLLVLTCGILGAPISLCPKLCSCTESGIYLEARCQSIDFLKNSLLSPEQIRAIVTLEIKNGFVTKINPDLSYFRNLKRLSLTSNKLETITAAHLPKSLEYIDLSDNLITNPPEDLHLLPNLKQVNLFGNPLSCTCDSLAVRDKILKKGVVIPKPVKCETPEDLRGKLWLLVTCKSESIQNLFDGMQGDAPYEGSGSDDIVLEPETEVTDKPEKWDSSIEEEFIPIVKIANVETAATTELAVTEPEEVEGSGDETEVTTELVILEEKQETTTAIPDYDEDYDYTDEPVAVSEIPVETNNVSLLHISPVKACNFNCSTPPPLQDSNDTNISPPPGLFEAIGIVANDLASIFPVPETIVTTTTTTTTESPIIPVIIPEAKGRALDINKKNYTDDAEIIGKNLNDTKEKENVSAEPTKQSNGTFIFLGVLLLLIVCLVIYAAIKKRSINRKRQLALDQPMEKKPVPEEVELLKKIVPQTDKPNGTHETIPLMNGHNENQHKTAEDISTPDAKDVSKPVEEDEDVELRPKKEEQTNLLTPEAKRVTIKASEIPNSTPKTPILVTRHVNSDGSIVTTPNIDQHV